MKIYLSLNIKMVNVGNKIFNGLFLRFQMSSIQSFLFPAFVKVPLETVQVIKSEPFGNKFMKSCSSSELIEKLV